MKNLLLKIIIFMLCLFTLILGTACTEPEAPAAPPTEPPALESWKHQVTNTEILETEHFLDAPDSVVYYDGSFENVVELLPEKANAIYTAFNEMQVGFSGRKAYHGFFDTDALEEKIATHGGIEFRYHQRRQYVGEPLQYKAVGGGEQSWDPGEKGAFDAMLVIPVGDKGFLIVPYLNGHYNETISYRVCYASLQYGVFDAVWQEIFKPVV